VTFRELTKRFLANIAPRSLYFSVNAYVATRDIAAGKRWENEIDQLAKYVHAGDSVIDVGANHGLYAFHLSRLVGPTGHVYSFEPLPPNFRILSHTVRKLKLYNVKLFPTACGERVAKTTFCVPLSHGVPQLGWAHEGSDGQTFKCDVTPLDDVVAGPVKFIKMDIEGAELFALRGAKRILSESRPVILLEAENHTERFGYQQQEIFDYLAGFGYRFFDGRLNEQPRFTSQGNYFFIPSQ
jgi:FkbM family methyltransferase